MREKRAFLNNIVRRKVNWSGYILRRNCLLHVTVEGNMMEVKKSRKKKKNTALL